MSDYAQKATEIATYLKRVGHPLQRTPAEHLITIAKIGAGDFVSPILTAHELYRLCDYHYRQTGKKKKKTLGVYAFTCFDSNMRSARFPGRFIEIPDLDLRIEFRSNQYTLFSQGLSEWVWDRYNEESAMILSCANLDFLQRFRTP